MPRRIYPCLLSRLTLQDVLALDQHRAVVEAILARAIRELTIEREVGQVERTWKDVKFNVIRHYKGDLDRGHILGPVDEIHQTLEDNMLNMQSMSTSRFVGPALLTLVLQWDKAMQTMAQVVDTWTELQTKWLYLEGVFVGGDIRSQLPEAARKFDDIDRVFQKVMADTFHEPNVLDCCMVEGRRESFERLIEGLERCRKSLTEYLNGKRLIFARFNFLSDDELLAVLGSSRPTVIQEYLGKMFDNLDKFRFGKDDRDRTVVGALMSTEGEVMDFASPVVAEGDIEKWMVRALEAMKRSNRLLTKKAVYEHGSVSDGRRVSSDVSRIWLVDDQS